MDARFVTAPIIPADDLAAAQVQWRRQMALFRRRRALLVQIASGAFVLMAVVIFALPLRYTASADVMIDLRRQHVVDVPQVMPDFTADAAVVDTEVEVLKSRSLAERVAARLHLDDDPEFSPARATPWRRWLTALRGRELTDEDDRRAALISRLRRRLKIARIGFTYVIAISFTASSGEKAARIANAFVDLYLQQQLDAKAAAVRRASDWLNARLGGLRQQVETAEQAVERYKIEHGLMTLADSAGATIPEQEISNLDSQLAAARGQQAEADARLAAAQTQIAAGDQGDDIAEVLNAPVVQDLRKQRDEADKQIAELQGRYGPRHPDLLKAMRQRSALDGQIRQEIGRVVSSLKLQAQVARGRVAAVAASLTDAKQSLAKINGASVGLKELERNLEAVRTLYQSFLDRSKQTAAQDGMAQADARLLSPARPPVDPAFPNRPLLLLMALMMSVLAGLISTWIAEVREDGLYTAEDVQRRLDLACLALIPLNRPTRRGSAVLAPIDAVLHEPMSAFTEAFRVVKTGLMLNRPSAPIRTLAVVSALAGEGKTTTCLCLGRVMARGGARVVVVDCDLRRRAMNRLSTKPPGLGLADVLSGTAALDAALVDDGETGLQLLSIGEGVLEDDVLETPAMDRLLKALKQRFQLVVLDTAPVLMVAETRSLAAKADAVLLVARWGRTPAGAAEHAGRTLQAAGAYLAGAVLTQVDPRQAGADLYGYGADYYPFYRPKTQAGESLYPGSAATP